MKLSVLCQGKCRSRSQNPATGRERTADFFARSSLTFLFRFTILMDNPASTRPGGARAPRVVGWLDLPYNHPDTANQIGDANRQITRDALIAANPYVNFAQFDTNGNGYISSNELLILVVVAGAERSYCSTPCASSVWGHMWSLYGTVSAPLLDGVQVGGGGYIQIGERHCCYSSSHQATIGIIVHELGHLLGLPDLYDYGYDSSGAGEWSLMALSYNLTRVLNILGFDDFLARIGPARSQLDRVPVAHGRVHAAADHQVPAAAARRAPGASPGPAAGRRSGS